LTVDYEEGFNYSSRQAGRQKDRQIYRTTNVHTYIHIKT
jgi:hypothetical protein